MRRDHIRYSVVSDGSIWDDSFSLSDNLYIVHRFRIFWKAEVDLITVMGLCNIIVLFGKQQIVQLATDS